MDNVQYLLAQICTNCSCLWYREKNRILKAGFLTFIEFKVFVVRNYTSVGLSDHSWSFNFCILGVERAFIFEPKPSSSFIKLSPT